jgi:hypothetical protein
VDGEHSPYSADPAEREKAVSFSKQWIDAAAIVGSPSVRTNIPPRKRLEARCGTDREEREARRRVRCGQKHRREPGKRQPGERGSVFLVKVIEQVNSPWLHALPDFANTLAAFEEDYAYKGIDAMFGKAYNISHVKETEVGDGKDKIAHVDLPRTFAIAKKHAYKGYFSMEWDSPGDPYAGTLGLIEKTLKNLS